MKKWLETPIPARLGREQVPLADRIEDRLEKISTTMHRLTREREFLKPELTRLRSGEKESLIADRLKAAGVKL